MKPKPPVVAILGHVDHGKTTLLDYIRRSNITAREKGGITQKIGAYEIEVKNVNYPINKITFIDTPGHELFSQLRARGAQIADLAILIIDAKDGIMPQTIESIAHIKQADIPFIVALNKVDLPEARPEKVKDTLMKYDVICDDRGGNITAVNIAAKTGQGVNDLLETILIIASDLNLQYNPNAAPYGFVIETKKDKRGVVATIILKEGGLSLGDKIYCLDKQIDIRAIINDRGENQKALYPSTPAEILGFKELPEVGSIISNQPKQITPISSQVFRKNTLDQKIDLNNLFQKEEKKIRVVIKTDNYGSLEAINYAIANNKKIEIILAAVGEINKSDVFLAKTTKAIIIGFNTAANQEVKNLAKEEKIALRTYEIIYQLIDELKDATTFLKEKEEEKRIKGEAKILAVFNLENQIVAGIKVQKGKINLGDAAEIYRGDRLIGKTKIVSLKTRAKFVEEVKKDQEAGMMLSPSLDFTIGDMIKCTL
jgi:translation initiation factor IF-2